MIQGIPVELEYDTFLSPKENTCNIIILDTRITVLFTMGSHKRNLSVIYINKNLYYSKYPTQRRNCHYLTLLNSAIYKQTVMTLARKMYPENSQKCVNVFNQPTQDPFGYLLVDLKSTTQESDRLRPNILEILVNANCQ